MPRGVDKVLVVAAWGFPPSWQLYDYRVRLLHKGFRGFDRVGGRSCSSCCSTLVLVSRLRDYFEHVRGVGVEVNTVVFGLDSVVDPSTTTDIRSAARERYSRWLEDLAGSCSCCDNIDLDRVRIAVLPGMGRYYGYEFEGKIDHLFNSAFAEIASLLGESRYKWVFLDLTHGLNFQLVSVLYATIAASVLFGLENRLVLVNSEPATGRRERCIKEQGKPSSTQQPVPGSLNILDVTRLQKVIHLVRGFAGLKRLETWWLRDAVKELRGIDEELVKILEGEVGPFFQFLKNGLVALAFPEAKYIDGDWENPAYLLETHPCRRDSLLAETGLKNKYYDPILVPGENKVSYPETSIYESLRYALRITVSDFCSILSRPDGRPSLLDFMDKINREVYGKYGYKYAELITRNTSNELKNILAYLKPALIEEKESSITVYTYRLLWSKKHELRKLLENRGRGTRRLKTCINEVKDIVNIIQEEKEKAEIREEQVRNAIAHSGLEFAVLEWFETSICDGKPCITGIVYDKSVREIVDYVSKK